MSLSSWINYQYITPLIYYINEISCRDDEELQALSLVNIIWGKTLLPVILLIHYNLANKWIHYDVYTQEDLRGYVGFPPPTITMQCICTTYTSHPSHHYII